MTRLKKRNPYKRQNQNLQWETPEKSNQSLSLPFGNKKVSGGQLAKQESPFQNISSQTITSPTNMQRNQLQYLRVATAGSQDPPQMFKGHFQK